MYSSLRCPPKIVSQGRRITNPVRGPSAIKPRTIKEELLSKRRSERTLWKYYVKKDSILSQRRATPIRKEVRAEEHSKSRILKASERFLSGQPDFLPWEIRSGPSLGDTGATKNRGLKKKVIIQYFSSFEKSSSSPGTHVAKKKRGERREILGKPARDKEAAGRPSYREAYLKETSSSPMRKREKKAWLKSRTGTLSNQALKLFLLKELLPPHPKKRRGVS